MRYYPIKTGTVNWKYDIREQATGGLIMDNKGYGYPEALSKKIFQLQQLWWEQKKGGCRVLEGVIFTATNICC